MNIFPPNTTVNFEFYLYCDILRRLRENVQRRRPELLHNNNWLLHYDNVPSHTSLKTTESVTKINMVIVPHRPYLPDLVHCGFAFPNWKWNWRDDVLKQCLTSKGNHKWYLTALRKITSTVLLKHWKIDEITVYIPKETILKEMAAKIEEVKPEFLFWHSLGTFRYLKTISSTHNLMCHCMLTRDPRKMELYL
jgi:hypothetical protein